MQGNAMMVEDLSAPRIGVLTYDLQPFTEDLLYRIQRACPEVRVTAYPCFEHSHQGTARIPARRSDKRPRPFGVAGRGVREAFTSSLNFGAAWRLVADNDGVMLYGLQGGTALLVALLARLRRRPVISVNHSLGPEMERRRRWWVRGLKRVLLSQCRLHISQMPAARDTLGQVYGVSPDRIIDAPFEGGASLYRDLAATKAHRRVAARTHHGLGHDDILFLFVGNIIPLKGPDLFIRALAQLPDPRVKGVMVGLEEPGYGPEGTVEFYRKMVSDHGLSERFVVDGQQGKEKLADLYAAADVFVLPTWKDCMPKVFIEAALFGLPIITTNAPGSVGVLPRHNESGYAVPVGDVSALVDAMVALSDTRRRDLFGENIKVAVDNFCDPEKEVAGFRQAIARIFRSDILMSRGKK
jgi:glycosyltransferase involved in cell wall biosynthesis